MNDHPAAPPLEFVIIIHPYPPSGLQLLEDVEYFMAEMREAGEEIDIVELACSLTSTGHDVKVRQALGGGENCFKNLYHEFLLVKVPLHSIHRRVLALSLIHI